MPNIGASLMDQEAVNLAPNLMGKKKKKKAKKKVNPNAYMDVDNVDFPGLATGHGAKPSPDRRMGSLANAGASIGHVSSYNDVNQSGHLRDPQDAGAALPDLDLDIGNEGDADDNANDWDYKEFAGAKVDYGSSRQGARGKFDINNLGNGTSFDNDDDLL